MEFRTTLARQLQKLSENIAQLSRELLHPSPSASPSPEPTSLEPPGETDLTAPDSPSRHQRRRLSAPELGRYVTTEEVRHETQQAFLLSHKNRIVLNVGGQEFMTSRSTLLHDPECMLASLVSGRFTLEEDERGAFFIDRDPTHFRFILNFLRDGSINHKELPILVLRDLLHEARFYSIKKLVSLLERDIRSESLKKRGELSNEKVYKVLTAVPLPALSETVTRMTMHEDYEFENWMVAGQTVNVLFSKKLSRGELRLLDRLQSST